MDRKNSIFLLLFILFVLLSWIFTGCSSTALMTRATVRERPDSLHLRMPPVQISASSDSLALERSPLDSLAVRGLTAVIDTVVGGTKVHANYEFRPHPTSPESSPKIREATRDRWSLQIVPKDTLVRWIVRDSIIEKPIEVQVVPFWIEVVLIASLIALVIALLKK